jgi:epoxyqueuosine reductase
MSRILIDACCGPCSLAVLDEFPRPEYSRHFLFYNPNIHPFREYRRRLESFEWLMQESSEEYTLLPYEPEEWIRAVAYREESRCEMCYRLRLRKAADLAMEESFDSLTTTLFASPYQDHDLLALLGDSICRSRGLQFIVWDGGDYYRETLKQAREKDMYTQTYCGCLLSERERYDKRVAQKR